MTLAFTGCGTEHIPCTAPSTSWRGQQAPDYPLKPYVVPKENSYWQEIMRLTDPFAPHRYYIRSQNKLVIADKQDEIMGAHNKLVIPGEVVDRLNATPVITKRVRRVIVKVRQ